MERKLKEIIKEAKSYLRGDFVLEDIFWLIEDTFSLQRYEIISKNEEYFDDEIIMERVKQAIKRPVSYILGYKDFYSYRFKVNEDVLIPRYETEELVDIIINDLKTINKQVKILDIGTGSGCIAITLDKKIIDAKVYASDISKKALNIAKINNDNLNANVEFFCSDVFNSLPKLDIDIIVSNPPYINKNNYVAERVKENEPHLALYADEEGLMIYRRIFEYVSVNYRNIIMYFEISPDLKEGLIKLKNRYLPNHSIEFIKDINGFIRFSKICIKN